MGTTRRKILSQLVGATALLTLAQGCAFFNLSNPILPSARFLAQPDPSMITVNYTYSREQNVINTEVQEGTVKVTSYPGDGTPGMFIHSYSAEYFDLAGKPIPAMFLAKANFGMASYLPAASSNTPTEVSLVLPIYNQQVRIYGMNQAFLFGGDVALNPNFSHTINARVTLYGEDDNFNQVQIPFNVPIRFEANIQQ